MSAVPRPRDGDDFDDEAEDEAGRVIADARRTAKDMGIKAVPLAAEEVELATGGGGGPPSPPNERAKLIHNEQVKLRATAMNTLAVGLCIAGIVGPLTIAIVNSVDLSRTVLALAGLWLVASLALHIGAVLHLRLLR